MGNFYYFKWWVKNFQRYFPIALVYILVLERTCFLFGINWDLYMSVRSGARISYHSYNVYLYLHILLFYSTQKTMNQVSVIRKVTANQWKHSHTNTFHWSTYTNYTSKSVHKKNVKRKPSVIPIPQNVPSSFDGLMNVSIPYQRIFTCSKLFSSYR